MGSDVLFLYETGDADALKYNGLRQNLAVIIGLCMLHQGTGNLALHILDLSAAAAAHMSVGRDICIKMIRFIAAHNALDFADGGKQRQSAVDGSKTDFWKLYSYIRINLLCSRMCAMSVQISLDRFSLAAMLLHGLLLSI